MVSANVDVLAVIVLLLAQGKAKKTRKFAAVKRLISLKDARM